MVFSVFVANITFKMRRRIRLQLKLPWLSRRGRRSKGRPSAGDREAIEKAKKMLEEAKKRERKVEDMMEEVKKAEEEERHALSHLYRRRRENETSGGLKKTELQREREKLKSYLRRLEEMQTRPEVKSNPEVLSKISSLIPRFRAQIRYIDEVMRKGG